MIEEGRRGRDCRAKALRSVGVGRQGGREQSRAREDGRKDGFLTEVADLLYCGASHQSLATVPRGVARGCSLAYIAVCLFVCLHDCM